MIYLLRLVTLLFVATALTLPYARGIAGAHLTSSLLDLLRRFQYVAPHRTLAPILVGACLTLAAAAIWPGQRGALWAATLVAGAWGVLMLAIPLGMAHVRPLYGYWINQTLLLCAGVALIGLLARGSAA